MKLQFRDLAEIDWGSRALIKDRLYPYFVLPASAARAPRRGPFPASATHARAARALGAPTTGLRIRILSEILEMSVVPI